jgi:hypothetical protein
VSTKHRHGIQSARPIPLRLTFRRFRIVAKSTLYLRHARPAVPLSVFRHCLRGSHWTDFRKISHWALVRTPVENLQISPQSGKRVKYCTCWFKYILMLLATLNPHKSAVCGGWDYMPSNEMGRLKWFRVHKDLKGHCFDVSPACSWRKLWFVGNNLSGQPVSYPDEFYNTGPDGGHVCLLDDPSDGIQTTSLFRRLALQSGKRRSKSLRHHTA